LFLQLVFYLVWSTYPAGMTDNKCGINQSIRQPNGTGTRYLRNPILEIDASGLMDLGMILVMLVLPLPGKKAPNGQGLNTPASHYHDW
jgi:hypothetical protein